ncbi:uncharacterized protein BO96DRAFT_114048 [Aspergillus niger CBS 101883]|nr:uncharacterized protein BO96DRAFT_114048 [Aspergillus niger CBS 101883]PYH53959.1 hypothetical protein BO96DRAFT_114048 [Aspergillus niger CBS 101883]
MLVDAKSRKIARKCGKDLSGGYVRCSHCRSQPAITHPAGKLAHNMPLADQSPMGNVGSDPPSLGRLTQDRLFLSMKDGVALKPVLNPAPDRRRLRDALWPRCRTGPDAAVAEDEDSRLLIGPRRSTGGPDCGGLLSPKTFR